MKVTSAMANQFGSVTLLMHDGSDEAYWTLYTRFVLHNPKLLRGIQNRLPSGHVADPVDIAGDALEKVWEKAQEGKHADFSSRNNLLALLTVYAVARASDARKKRHEVSEAALAGSGGAAELEKMTWNALQPTEGELRAALEGIEDRLAMLGDDLLRAVAEAALEELSQQEIAERLGTNLKRVERALTEIRRRWTCEYVDAFRESCRLGAEPRLEPTFNEFRLGGKWLFRELLEIELHERLKGGWPISLREMQTRPDFCEFANVVQRVVKTQLFFDERPSEGMLARLLDALEPSLQDVIRRKCQGQTNEQIAQHLGWSVTNVRDTLDHARQQLASLEPTG